jgi:hypothetical protein
MTRPPPIGDRARAYLEINCAHCHNPAGAASNSGLFLDWPQRDPGALGILKRPVAAGVAAAIATSPFSPALPTRRSWSIGWKGTDPGIAMPELGRATVHKEGIALVRTWIDGMPKTAPAR